MPGWVLAVDFGTSNTAAAHTSVRSGEVETLPLSHQANLMPSAVFVESPHSILVGDVALDRAQSNPAAFIPSPKLRVGRGMVRVGGHDVPDSVLVAAVLRSVVERGTAVHNGQRAQQVVLTHPEAWSPVQIQVLIDAAGQVGFDRSMVKTVSEPRAAAHFYTRTNAVAPGGRIAVFDFGGGTLDIAVLEKTDQHTFTVTAARGDNMLGGKNLDAAIRGWVDDQLEDRDPRVLDFLRAAASGPDTAGRTEDGARALRDLDDSIRGAKELLSEAPSATVDVIGAGMHETLSITRGEFDEVIRDQIDRAMTLAWHTFQNAGLTGPQDLTALYLTGGSSRIPLVHERLQALGPVATLDDPKTVVVRGALDAIGATATPTPPAPRRTETAGVGTREPVPAAPAPITLSRRGLAIGAAAVVVAVAVAGGVGVMMSRDQQAPVTATTSASGDSDAVTASGDGGGANPVSSPAKSLQAKDVKSVLAQVPPPLERDSSCKKQDFTPEGALQVWCDLNAGVPIIAGIKVGKMPSYMAWVDSEDAAKTLATWEDVDPKKLAPATSKTSGAMIEEIGESSASLTYANADTGLMISMRGFGDRAAVIMFLQRANLS